MKTSPMVVGIFFVLAALAGTAGAQGGSGALAPEALKADPWVTPPRTADETRARVAELRERFAPFLRSLPRPLETRQRRELDGAWRSKFEVANAETGRRPAAPEWYREDLDDSAWEKATVPEWRWLPVQKGKRWYPASCILWYRTRFEAAPAPAGQRTFLCFAGVDWEAEVWLNGKPLGRHMTYYEPFRFDVTGLLRERNTLAVRVIEGPLFGEPMSQWSLLPFVPGDAGESQHYVMGDRAASFPNDKFGSTSSLGSGFGIHREVYLETTGEACISGLFARGDLVAGAARVSVEIDATAAKDATLEVQILPENFEGRSYQKTEPVILHDGMMGIKFPVVMPEAKTWWPTEPNLYRCRAILRKGERVIDARDALFGMRSFGVVTASPPHPGPGLAEGTFLLNGRPVFLRGTNLSGALNAYWYWGQQDNLLRAALTIKAANFNIVRTCQHVSFPEVRELFDRLGIMSEQDQGAGFEIGADVPATLKSLAQTGTLLARTCYNNAGVVLLSFANESKLDMTAVVRNALEADPERILVPMSGGTFTLTDPRDREHLVVDSHPYEGWYQGVGYLWESARTRPAGRLMTLGEYGAEALDAYETMRDHYPKQWGPPPAPNEDKLWGSRQVGTGTDLRQQFGFRGKKPANLGEYIEASQNYQADVLAEATKGFRISKAAIGGYFQFHFIDGTAAQWPKAIVSHDFTPKKGYYEMAQVSQPLVPLYRIVDRGAAMEIWVVNDLATTLTGCRVNWMIGESLTGGAAAAVPASGAALCAKVDLKALPAEAEVLGVALTLSDAEGRTLSRYGREVYRSFKFEADGKAAAELTAFKKSFRKMKNIAAGQPATATSAAESAAPALAVDGGTRTGWRAAGKDLPQALTVDLGARTALAGARVVWEGDAQREVKFEVSDDGKKWRPVTGKPRSATLTVPRPPLVFLDQYFLFSGAGRYLRITIAKISDGGVAGFNEIEVYEK